MSWGTISVTAKCAEARAALEAAYAEYVATSAANNYDIPVESHEQIAASIKAAATVAESAACGEYVRIMLGGHSNPNHKPVAGWANDSVFINVWSTEPDTIEPAATLEAAAEAAVPALV